MDITQDEQNCILLILVCIEFSFQLLHYYMCITYVCCVSYILGDFRLSVDDLQRMPALHCGKKVSQLCEWYCPVNQSQVCLSILHFTNKCTLENGGWNQKWDKVGHSW